MRVLVTGGSGQIGHALLACRPQGIECLAPSSHELDLSEPQQISQLLSHWRPELIINAAAYTAVDRAESEPERPAGASGRRASTRCTMFSAMSCSP